MATNSLSNSHQKPKSSSLSFVSGLNLRLALPNRMWQKWCCVSSELRLNGLCSLCSCSLAWASLLERSYGRREYPGQIACQLPTCSGGPPWATQPQLAYPLTAASWVSSVENSRTSWVPLDFWPTDSWSNTFFLSY